MPRLTWVLLCYFGSQLGPFSMLVFYTLHEKLLYYVVIVNWSDYVVKLREHDDSKRPQWTTIVSSAYLFIKIFFLFFFLLLSVLLSLSFSLSLSSLLLLLVFYCLRAIAQPNLST